MSIKDIKLILVDVSDNEVHIPVEEFKELLKYYYDQGYRDGFDDSNKVEIKVKYV